jgi:hypothetical protein
VIEYLRNWDKMDQGRRMLMITFESGRKIVMECREIDISRSGII